MNYSVSHKDSKFVNHVHRKMIVLAKLTIKSLLVLVINC